MNALIVIYGPRLVSEKQMSSPAGLEIYHVFNSKGLVDEEILLDYFSDICKDQVSSLGKGRIGHFSDGEQVQRFCFQLCQKLGHSGVSLLTVREYNNVLSSCHQASDFTSLLKEKGEFIENVDAQKRGFFDNIFNGLKN